MVWTARLMKNMQNIVSVFFFFTFFSDQSILDLFIKQSHSRLVSLFYMSPSQRSPRFHFLDSFSTPSLAGPTAAVTASQVSRSSSHRARSLFGELYQSLLEPENCETARQCTFSTGVPGERESMSHIGQMCSNIVTIYTYMLWLQVSMNTLFGLSR